VKIAVCVKRVPDTETRIKIGPDGRSIDESGVKFVMNPYDEFAVEEALQLRDKAGTGEVVVVSMGGDVCQETIRTALAMGADRGVLLKTDGVTIDPVSTGKVLAAELREGQYDLVLFGKLAIDDYNHAVGNVVAELLDLPCVSAIGHLEIANGRGTAEREIEGGVEVVEFGLPAVLTTDKGLNEPRYPALRGIMMAKKKPLEVKAVELSGGGLTVEELSVPPERAEGRIVGEGPDAVPVLLEALRSEAKVL
jgi:electron transfer flavoprotein beta subunit